MMEGDEEYVLIDLVRANSVSSLVTSGEEDVCTNGDLEGGGVLVFAFGLLFGVPILAGEAPCC